jgi:heme A synthase
MMELVAIHNNLTGFIFAMVIGVALCAWGRDYERKYRMTSALAVVGMVAVYAAMIVNTSKMGHMIAGLFALGMNILNTAVLREKREDIFYASMFVVALIVINAMMGFALS